MGGLLRAPGVADEGDGLARGLCVRDLAEGGFAGVLAAVRGPATR